MSETKTLLDRNRVFSSTFEARDLPILPKMRTVVLACADARVDPAHIFGLELGDAVIIRNNGGRVTPAVIEEIATLAFMVAMMDGENRQPFELVLVQHTQCGAERFADPGFQKALKAKVGVDVSEVAIIDHELSLQDDIESLRNAPGIPNYVVVSGYIYDVQTGQVREIVSPAPLSQ